VIPTSPPYAMTKISDIPKWDIRAWTAVNNRAIYTFGIGSFGKYNVLTNLWFAIKHAPLVWGDSYPVILFDHQIYLFNRMHLWILDTLDEEAGWQDICLYGKIFFGFKNIPSPFIRKPYGYYAFAVDERLVISDGKELKVKEIECAEGGVMAKGYYYYASKGFNTIYAQDLRERVSRIDEAKYTKTAYNMEGAF